MMSKNENVVRGSCSAADDVMNAAFEEAVPQKERLFYGAAAACGLLSWTLRDAPSVFSGFDFDSFESTKEKNMLSEIIVYAAGLDGCRDSDSKKAIQYLNSSREAVELSSKASVSGLFFSLLSQFRGMLCCRDVRDGFTERPLPDYYEIGDSREDKILLGFMYWLFYVSCLWIRNGGNVPGDTNIPDELKSLLSDLLSRCDFSDLTEDCKEAEKRYSEWLGKMVVCDRQNDAGGMDLFFLLREKMAAVCRDTFPVVLNFCLVRAVYMVCRISSEKESLPVPSFTDLLAIDLDRILPRDHRLLSDMCLISAAAFAGQAG